jgi:hypothetical protein
MTPFRAIARDCLGLFRGTVSGIAVGKTPAATICSALGLEVSDNKLALAKGAIWRMAQFN